MKTFAVHVFYIMLIDAEDSDSARDKAQNAELPYYKTDSMEIDAVVQTTRG